MACEGRTGNRMLRKRWTVRNPAVEEDGIRSWYWHDHMKPRGHSVLYSPLISGQKHTFPPKRLRDFANLASN